MSALNKLREQIRRSLWSWAADNADLRRCIDTDFAEFKEKHPGLVDLTTCSKNCPGWVFNPRKWPNGNQCVRTTLTAHIGKACPVFTKPARVEGAS